MKIQVLYASIELESVLQILILFLSLVSISAKSESIEASSQHPHLKAPVNSEQNCGLRRAYHLKEPIQQSTSLKRTKRQEVRNPSLQATRATSKASRRRWMSRRATSGSRQNGPDSEDSDEEEQIPVRIILHTERRRVCSSNVCPDDDTETAEQASDNNKTRQVPSSPEQAYAQTNTIETAVFIDPALDNKFAGLSGGFAELNKQVLTIMNQVQHLFRYSSLSIPITIKLKLVERIKDFEKRFGEPAPNPAQGDIDAYLSNFCQWQQACLSKQSDLSWDHAILLSGLDLYKTSADRKTKQSAVLGLAWVGGMCKPAYSCTINEAANFESAFVIAHEIGHNLGIAHDGAKNNCDPNKFIMSDKTGAGKIHWSACSNDYLRDAIKRGQLTCLDSQHTGKESVDSMYDLAKLKSPGQVYSVADQCKLAFGASFAPFVTRQAPFNIACKELWCSDKSLAKPAHPALEGSVCDTSKQCREGKCEDQPLIKE